MEFRGASDRRYGKAVLLANDDTRERVKALLYCLARETMYMHEHRLTRAETGAQEKRCLTWTTLLNEANFVMSSLLVAQDRHTNTSEGHFSW